MVKIAVILGSSRENSIGKRLIKYIEGVAKNQDNIEFSFLKLSDYQLTFFHEKLAPMQNENRQLPENEARWIADVATADGFIILTPEYNHAIPAVLKNAIDYLAFEGQRKPVKIMGYSDNMRGAQFATAELVPILNRLGFITLPAPTLLGIVDQIFTEDGQLIDDAKLADYTKNKIAQTLQEIKFYTQLFVNNPFPGK
ncbi:NADPH-dependent FMN reductase [Dellaglioa sp. P0083]|uniref:NADPH-dependent FMN reductase n=1 Tax=Dellaglioa kimchii TaxID=3344667 RepID=UPI0038D4B272